MASRSIVRPKIWMNCPNIRCNSPIAWTSIIRESRRQQGEKESILPDIRDYIRAGRAELKATLIIRGGNLVNVASDEIYPADIAIYHDRIVALGDVKIYEGKHTETIDAKGYYLCPGMIDGHLHVECSHMS